MTDLTDSPVEEDEEIQESGTLSEDAPQFNPAHLIKLQELLDDAEALRPIIMFDGVGDAEGGLVLQDNYALYEHMINTTGHDPNSLDSAEGGYQMTVLDTILRLATASGYSLDSLANELGMTRQQLDYLVPPEGLTTDHLMNVLRHVGMYAEVVGVEESLLDEAEAIVLGYDTAITTDENRPEAIARANEKAEWFKANGTAWANQLATLATRIQEIRDIGEVFGKSTAPVADAFQAYYDGEMVNYQGYEALVQTRQDADLAEMEDEREVVIRWHMELTGNPLEYYEGLDIGEMFTGNTDDAWYIHQFGTTARKDGTELYGEVFNAIDNITEAPEHFESVDHYREWLRQRFINQVLIAQGIPTVGQILQAGSALTWFVAGIFPLTAPFVDFVDALVTLYDYSQGDANAVDVLLSIIPYMNDIARTLNRTENILNAANDLRRSDALARATDDANQNGTHRLSQAHSQSIEAFRGLGGRVRTARRPGADASVSLRKRRRWYGNDDNISMRSLIDDPEFPDDRRLIKEADKLIGTEHENQMNRLIEQLSQGNLNPGINTKHLEGTNIYYSRSRGGARLFWRIAEDGAIEILGKSTKANEDRVIRLILERYSQ